MGLVYASISLRNPREPQLHPVEVQALVDAGATHLCMPESVAIQLKLETAYEREVTQADGSTKRCPYVGPVEVRFDGRASFTGALVLGDEVLLGAAPMEDMDLIISPMTHNVVPNPRSPNIPHAIVK